MKLTNTVLERGYLMSLAIVDEQGPWVADVIYVFDDACNLYWMSKSERRHSCAIDGGENYVAATVTVTTSPDQPDEGLQISGTASRVSNPTSSLLTQWMQKKRKDYTPDMGLVLDKHVWYQLTPDRIELIYENEFGYDRQTVRQHVSSSK